MAGISINAPPALHKVIAGLVQGKERSIALLNGAIRFFEEKMQDDFPGEPLEQVALSARTTIANSGMGSLTGLQAKGLVGNAGVSIQNDTPTGGEAGDIAAFTGVVENYESRFIGLQARVALLESSLTLLRHELASPAAQRIVGPGHNQGPDFEPIAVEELSDVDDLIAQLKEQGPVPPADTTKLTERSQNAARVSGKIKQYLDGFAVEAFKGAGGEVGKRLAQAPFWMAVVYSIGRVTEALALWLAHVPQ
jgi:hypothetical protein